MMLTSTILCISFFSLLVHGSPLVLRDVFNPAIITPNKDTVWVVGTTQTVTWQTSNIPPNLTNPNGTVLLGQLGPGGEHLQINNPLAKNFKLTDGKVQITVPNTPPRNDYIIVLMGDSGNASPTFAISDNRPIASPTSTSFNSLPIPITGSTITGGTTTDTQTTTSPIPTPTSPLTGPSSSTGSSTSSGSSTSTTTSPAASPSRTNSAWTSSHIDSTKSLTIGMLSLFLVFLA